MAGTSWHCSPAARKGARRILVFLFSHHISHFSLSSCHQRQNVPPDEAFPDSWLLPHEYWMSKWQRHHHQQLCRASVTVMGRVALTHPVGAATQARQGQDWDRGRFIQLPSSLQFYGTVLLGSFWGSLIQLPALAAAALQDLCLGKGTQRRNRSQNTPGPCGRHWQNREQGPCPPRSEKPGGKISSIRILRR